jgi:hypothetical protein
VMELVIFLLCLNAVSELTLLRQMHSLRQMYLR